MLLLQPRAVAATIPCCSWSASKNAAPSTVHYCSSRCCSSISSVYASSHRSIHKSCNRSSNSSRSSTRAHASSCSEQEPCTSLVFGASRPNISVWRERVSERVSAPTNVVSQLTCWLPFHSSRSTDGLVDDRGHSTLEGVPCAVLCTREASATE